MKHEELIYYALVGVRAEREAAWKEYLETRRAGDEERGDRLADIYTKLDEDELEIATMEVTDDEY